MSKFLAWWNGNKTLIGGLCSWVAANLIGGLIIGVWEYQPDFLLKIQESLVWAGNVLVVTGLAHKTAKAVGIAKKPKVGQ